MTVGLVNDGAALKSMRDSDFDTYSAIGEVIDNSLQANSTHIKLKINYKLAQRVNGFEPITSIVLGDDGDGMSKDILHHCLQLGYSSRYNDRSGIGRFGVGATLAAIHECRRVEIYSKEKGGSWNYTYIDLDLVSKEPPEMVSIPEPIEKNLPDEFKTLTGDEKGTVVIWSKYDRQQESASKLIEELKIWVGRTFRTFIWKNIRLFINGDEVKAIDPLYVKTAKTKFPEDSAGHEYQPIKFSYPISNLDRTEDGPEESEIKIRLSLVPEELRPTQGSGNSKAVADRYIHLNEGLSILRNGREVFYGHIPYWGTNPFKEIDRWWGCEISFDAVLDSAFMVRNIKRGAVPIKELKVLIKDKIEPTRNTAIQTVQEVWQRVKAEKDKSSSKANGAHSEAEVAAKATPSPKNIIDVDKNLDEEAKKITEALLTDATQQQKTQWETKFKSQPFTIMDAYWKGSDFIETDHLGGADVIKYNTNHAFFHEINSIKDELNKSSDSTEIARKIIALLDLLLMSFSKAEAMFEKGEKLSPENFSEVLKNQWGNYLSSYIKSWRETREQ